MPGPSPLVLSSLHHTLIPLLLQALWGLSALTILPISISFLPVFLAKDLPKIPNTHVDVVSGAAAVISLIGELFMIKVGGLCSLL
jgi:hypothetical protein